MKLHPPSARGWRIALFAVLAAGWVLGGLPRLHVGSGIESFLPAEDASVRALDQLTRSFGGDPVVVLLESSKPDTLLDAQHLPALLELEGKLSGLDDVAVVYGPATTLNQTVIRVQDLLAELSGERDALREAGRTAAAKRFDQRYGQLIVQGLPGGLPTLRNPGFVSHVVFGEGDRVNARWAQFVPNHRAVAIYVRPRQHLDQEAAARLTDAVTRTVRTADTGADRVTVTGSPVVTAELAKQATSELPWLAGSALAAVALILLLFPWNRRSRRLAPLGSMVVAAVMTLAWFGWRGGAVSLGAVAFLPVILGVGSYYPAYLTQRAHRRRILAVAAAAAAAFGSLGLSPLPFVRDLGEAVALGIGFAVLCTLVVSSARAESGPVDDVGLAEPALTARSTRSGRALLAVAGVVALVGWFVLPRIPVVTDPQRLMHGVHALDGAQHAEDVLGFSAEIDVVLRGPDVLAPQALTWLRSVQSRIVTRHGDALRPVVSPVDLLDFLGRTPTAGQIDAAMRLLPSYLSGAAVTPDRREAAVSLGGTWRELTTNREVLDDVRSLAAHPPAGYHADVTGLPVASDRGYDLVSASRYEANLVGIAGAVLVLLLLLRRRSDVVLALAAAVVATGVAVFVVWAGGLSLNPLTLALGPLTAAAGCEYAVLLAAARARGDLALRRSVHLAAALSVAGYGVLVFSGLPVVRQFGLALVFSVVCALVGAHVVSRLVRSPIPSSPRRPVIPSRVLEEVGAQS